MSPYLFDIRRQCWEPGVTHLTVGFPQEYTPAMCWDFALEFNHLSDLVNLFRLLCVLDGDDVSSFCVPRGYLIGPYHNRPC